MLRSDKSFLIRLDKISSRLSSKSAKGADPAALCKVYTETRPLMLALLPFVRKIPVYGQRIAQVIEFLMKIADSLCPGFNKIQSGWVSSG